jgi:hypothetical protein
MFVESYPSRQPVYSSLSFTVNKDTDISKQIKHLESSCPHLIKKMNKFAERVGECSQWMLALTFPNNYRLKFSQIYETDTDTDMDEEIL